MGGLWWCRRHAKPFAEAVTFIKGDSHYSDFFDTYANEVAEGNRRADQYYSDHLSPERVIIHYAAEVVQARRAIETGTALGWSSMMFLLSLEKRSNSLLISTNTVQPTEMKERLIGEAIPQRCCDKWKLIKKPDIEALPEAFQELPEIDICHYDSDKTYRGRMRTYKKLWQALRPGGIFMSDDVDDNLGFANFARSVGVRPIVYPVSGNKEKYAGILWKPE